MTQREYDIDIRVDLTEVAKQSEGDEDGRFTYLAIRSSNGYDEEPSIHTIQFDCGLDHSEPDSWTAYGVDIGERLRAGVTKLMDQDAFWQELGWYFERNHRKDLINSFVDVEVWLRSMWPLAGCAGPHWVVEVCFVTQIGNTPMYFAGWIFTQGP